MNARIDASVDARFASEITRVAIGCGVWLLLALSGGVAIGLFLPLMLFSVLIPAVLFGFSDAPLSLRPLLAALPSVMAIVSISYVSSGPESRTSLMTQIIGGGAVATVVPMTLTVLCKERLFAKRGASSSFSRES
jgi:hypothetical protein